MPSESSRRGPIPRACEQCGAPFFAYPSQVARGGGRFCAPACANRQPRPRTRHLVTLHCPVCGVAFEVYPNAVRRGRTYCDKTCAAAGMAAPTPLVLGTVAAGSQAAPLPGEEWRPVVGYEGLYEVSNLARVRNVGRGFRRTPGRLKAIVRPNKSQLYPVVQLNKHGVTKPRQLHRIVADAFLGLLPDGFHTDHINGLKTDARATNLEYVPLRENLRRARAMGLARWLKGEENPHARLTNEDIRAIRCLHAAGFALAYIGALFFVDGRHVWRIAKREKWAHVP